MEVTYKKTAQRVLRRMQPKKAAAILDKMDDVAKDPFKKDALITPLEGTTNGYRRRFGDWRVLYTVDTNIKILDIFKIGSRGEIYK